MTPTPEDIELAERIADETGTPRGCQVWTTAKTAALTAAMEVREKVDKFCEDSKPLPNSYNCDVVAETLDDLQRAIRNGEHLR